MGSGAGLQALGHGQQQDGAIAFGQQALLGHGPAGLQGGREVQAAQQTLVADVQGQAAYGHGAELAPQQTQPGMPDMKMLTYAMPVMFMFIMNTFPAGLSFYYFVSKMALILVSSTKRRIICCWAMVTRLETK